MIREFHEETGVWVFEWTHYARTTDNKTFNVEVYCKRVEHSITFESLKTKTDEEVIIVDVESLHLYKTIENVFWLVYVALDHLHDGSPAFAEIRYPSE